ncbi:MAG: hypothetical protein IKS13_06565 [Ruminococcus sp.]|nr:hypothetical protein [Ruminococcus sp.]
MITVSRTPYTEELKKRFIKKYANAKVKFIILMILLLFIGLVCWGFAALDDSRTAKILSALFFSGGIASFIGLIHNFIVRSRDFQAFTLDETQIIYYDCASAFIDDTQFGKDVNIKYRGTIANTAKASRNLDSINSADDYDDFIKSLFFTKHSVIVKEVISIKEGKKYIKLRFKRQTWGEPKDSLYDIMPKTVHIPVDYTNLDELLMRLRDISST